MKIVTKKEICKYPNGTVFSLYKPDVIDDAISVITGHVDEKDGWNEEGWISELSLVPFHDNLGITEWTTEDTTSWEYDDDQLFVVYNKTEVVRMIDCLLYALSGCKGGFDYGYVYEHEE